MNRSRITRTSTIHTSFFVVLILATSIVAATAAEAPTPRFPPIALVNNVSFQDSTFNNELAGNGFLIQVAGDTLACTCKHALWVAKSDEMTGIHFENTLNSWLMHPKFQPGQSVTTEKLINADRQEPIGPDNTNVDWLVFTVAQNSTSVVPLALRDTPLVASETLYAIGWSFQDRAGPQQVHPFEYYKTVGSKILLRDIGPRMNLAGLSGGAVVDSRQRLVGIISDFTADPDDGQMYLSPCSTDYLRKVLTTAGYLDRE